MLHRVIVPVNLIWGASRRLWRAVFACPPCEKRRGRFTPASSSGGLRSGVNHAYRQFKKSERPPEGGEPAGVAISERGWEEDAPPGHVKEIGEEVYLFERELLTAGALGDETNVAACDAEIVELAGGKPRKLRNSALIGPPVAVGASKRVEHDSLCVHVQRELAARLVRRQRSDPMTKK